MPPLKKFKDGAPPPWDADERARRERALQAVRELVARLVPPGVSLSEELIADRRAEALREENE